MQVLHHSLVVSLHVLGIVSLVLVVDVHGHIYWLIYLKLLVLLIWWRRAH